MLRKTKQVHAAASLCEIERQYPRDQSPSCNSVRVRRRLATLAVSTLIVLETTAVTSASISTGALALGGFAHAGRQKASSIEQTQSNDTNSDERAKKVAAVDSYLRHIYSVYLGVRACTEMSTEQKDQSFLPSVSLDEARKTLKSIDAAAAEVKIDSNASWVAAAPRAEVTAEALKIDPAKHLGFCQKMGSLFRVDGSNLQSLLTSLGAKTPIIQKDY
ncbi:MAG: hypothetical protein OTI36_03230 [Beijerinckiaceae bacterium]|nr:hypothetical protein [Beijerinckiaceae bacterium]